MNRFATIAEQNGHQVLRYIDTGWDEGHGDRPKIHQKFHGPSSATIVGMADLVVSFAEDTSDRILLKALDGLTEIPCIKLINEMLEMLGEELLDDGGQPNMILVGANYPDKENNDDRD